ncbi:vitelline membrane outer layer protein 1 homolog [Procambarus clarkii]|uniref:vitelline membrane outer layer protein 1 homolog n=1 Tax=Procambarus clarkii TaxID=6728 RepID=UPI003743EFEC
MKCTFGILLCVAGVVMGRDSTISSANGGPWGDWGEASFCPRNSYATGFDIKVERPVSDGDDTALNGIRFYCRSGLTGLEVATISSSVQKWGDWTGKYQCRNGRLNAFRLRVESHQGSGDDTAADSLDMRCETGEELTGGGNSWGTWGSWQTCPSGQVICGLQTRVEKEQGKGDDTALNDVTIYCCS